MNKIFRTFGVIMVGIAIGLLIVFILETTEDRAEVRPVPDEPIQVDSSAQLEYWESQGLQCFRETDKYFCQ